MRGGRAEEGHHRVADEFLDGPAVALELGAQPLVVGPQNCVDILRVQRFGARCEADEIGEQHRNDLALPLHSYLSRSTW